MPVEYAAEPIYFVQHERAYEIGAGQRACQI